MALGDNYSNNKDKEYNPVLYSKVKFSNIDGFDPSALSFNFWNGLLKVSISPKKAGDEIRFDHENNISIYLSHMKALQLALEIEKFLADPKTYCNNTGVSTNKGIIYISNGVEETGSFNPIIFIREIDENLKPVASFAYQCKKDHYVVQNYNESTGKFDKAYNELIELISFKTLLEEYYHAICGGYAYANIEYGKYDNSRLNTKLDSIANKLGVEYNYKSNSGGGSNSTNKFDKTEGARTYSMNDLDDIDGLNLN